MRTFQLLPSTLLLALLTGCGSMALSVTPGAPTSAPILSLSTTTLTFVPTVINASNTLQVTVGNTGNATLNITGVSASGNYFSSSVGSCGSIAAGSSCVLSVIFTPTGVGSFTGTLSLTDNSVGSPHTVSLSGSGVIAIVPLGSLTPATLSFGNVVVNSAGVTLNATLTSSGSGPLTITSVTASTNFTASSSCVSPLAAPSTCTIAITFVPTLKQAYTGTLTVSTNAANSPMTVALSGTGIALPSPNSCTSNMTTSPSLPAPTANYAGIAFTGSVKAGMTGIVGASVQVYAAGTTGNASTPTALFATPLTTDTNGNFSVPASFTCPYSNSVLYAVATGGKAGSSGTTNSGIVLMSVLGVCNSLKTNGSYVINEATTVTSAYAMHQFLAAGAKMGATATNSSGIGLAAGTYANLININLGTMPGINFPSTGVAPTARIYTLANALNACIVSTGPTSTACSQLYTASTAGGVVPATTLDAALSIANNPGTNVSSLYTLSGTSTVYSPVLTAAPADWTMFATYSGGGMNDPSGLGIDSLGNVWVANYFNVVSYFTNTGTPIFTNGLPGNQLEESYGAAVDYANDIWIDDEQSVGGFNGDAGSVDVFNTAGTQLGILGVGGINFPLANAFDTSNNMWVVDYGDSSVSVYATTPSPIGATSVANSPFTSAQLIFPVAIAIDSKCNAWVANQASNTVTKVSGNGSNFASFVSGSGPSGVAVDQSDNAWAANYYGNTIGLVSAAGATLSGSGYSGGGLNHPQGIAVDGSGAVWVANYRGPSISELAGSTTSVPGSILSPATGWGPDSQMLEAFALQIDASGNIWVTNFGNNTLVEFVGMAAPVKTPLLGPVRIP
jgi:hypothetical protein